MQMQMQTVEKSMCDSSILRRDIATLALFDADVTSVLIFPVI